VTDTCIALCCHLWGMGLQACCERGCDKLMLVTDAHLLLLLLLCRH
jgi:hypothetical protein